MKTRMYSMSSSSDEEVLIVLKQAKENPNSYENLCKESVEQCEFCDDVFRNRYTLIQHNITHMIIPLTNSYSCKDCRITFTSTEDLESHNWKQHGKLRINHRHVINEKMPEILKSIIEKQVLVKCVDDINELVKLNGNNGSDKQAHDAGNSKINDGNKVTEIGNIQNIVIDDMERFRVKGEPHDIERNKEANIIKEEPFSPTLIKERASSPTDDEKEPIRHRLLFEEDIETTLFKDISDECHVNIETLCQEVSLDFDDALLVSDSDDTMSLGHVDSFEIKHSENGMTNFDGITSFQNVIQLDRTNNFKNEMNGLNNKRNDFVLEINNLRHSLNKCENELGNFDDGMDNFKFKDHDAAIDLGREQTELQYGPAVHYDVLMEPALWICRYCSKEFPNRYALIQHEPKHLQLKKKRWVPPLCCICDKYMSGNHYTLRNHMASKHPGVDQDIVYMTYPCSRCGLKFHNYNKHMRNYHGPYRCEKCPLGFETEVLRNDHQCPILDIRNNENRNENQEFRYALMKLCELCFSFMKIYMQNRQNYEEIGTKTELGVRQTCDKCDKEFFSVKLVKRKILMRVGVDRYDGRKVTELGQNEDFGRKVIECSQKLPDACQKAADVNLKTSDVRKKSDFDRKTSDFVRKKSDHVRKTDLVRNASDFSQKVSDFVRKTSDMKSKMKPTKPMSNKDRLLKIQNRLKMMKMINKC